MKIIASMAILLSLGCSFHEVTTAEEWCQQITGVDLIEKNAPFWAILPGISFKGDAIRDGVVATLNRAFQEKMDEEKMENQSVRMVWREGNDLHLWNLATFFEVEPDEIINEWRAGIDLSKAFKDPDDQHRCVYGTITSLFDNVIIHTGVWDQYGFELVRDDVTTIATERRERLKDPL